MASKVERRRSHKDRVERRKPDSVELLKTVMGVAGLRLASRENEAGETVYFMSPESAERIALAQQVADKLNVDMFEILTDFASTDQMKSILERIG